jgi:hypothetical protein
MGAGILALIFSFFAFYSYDPKGPAKLACSSQRSQLSGIEKQLCGGDSASAWHGFFGWFGALLVLIAAVGVMVAVFAPQLTLPVSIRLIGAGVAALGVLFLILALFIIPDWPPIADLVTNQSQYDAVIDNSVGFSWYVVLILALVVVALSFVRFQQTGGGLPGRFGAARTGAGAGAGTEQGGYSPTTQQYPQQYPQQPGQGQPAPPQGPPQGAPSYEPRHEPQAGQPGEPPHEPEQEPPPGYGQQQPPPGYGQQPPPGYGQQPPPGYGQQPPPGYTPPPGQTPQ